MGGTMLVVSQDAMKVGSQPISNDIARLVNDVGTTRFEEALEDMVRSHLHCAQVTAFSFDQDHTPKNIGLFGKEKVSDVRHAAFRYQQTHWKKDPSNKLIENSASSKKSLAVVMSRRDIEDDNFLEDCYIKTHVGQRLSFISNYNGTPFKLSFHRHEKSGVFEESEIENVFCHATTLMSLILKHCEIAERARTDRSETEIFEEVLEKHYPELTKRERTVCGLIAIGMSSEAISITLGISINTVLTFRKRAYARLNISTQNELLRMLYSAQTAW